MPPHPTFLAHLAQFVAGPAPDRLAVIHADTIAVHLVDTLAALAAGATSAIGRSLLATESSPDRPYLSVPTQHWLDRAALSSAIIRSTDIDDIHRTSCVTPSSAVVPPALALAEAMGGDAAARVPGAVLAGAELMIRLAQACRGPEILYAGIWPTSLTAALGAAASCARMLDLDAATTAHALGGALSIAAGRMGPAPGTLPMRWFLFGQQVRTGCLAALAAARGEEADLNLLDGRWLDAVLAAKPDLDTLTRDLGETCALAETSIKFHCGAKMITSGLQGFQDLLRAGLDPATIERVDINVPSLLVGILDRGVSEADSLSWFTSAPLQMALAAYRPNDLLTVDRRRITLTDPMRLLMSKVRVQADPALDRIYPRHWPATVRVTTATGIQSASVTFSHGDPEAPLSPAELTLKWRRLFAESPVNAPAEAWLGGADTGPDLVAALTRAQARIVAGQLKDVMPGLDQGIHGAPPTAGGAATRGPPGQARG
jgi:2-methylcitrate dehydratase PrpD